MTLKTRIKIIAKEKGMTLSNLSKILGITRSNMSAIASGARGVSLKLFIKISHILDCDIDELSFNMNTMAVYKNKEIQSLLKMVGNRSYNGQDKTWVHRIMLAQHIHYRIRKRI